MLEMSCMALSCKLQYKGLDVCRFYTIINECDNDPANSTEAICLI